MFPYIDRDTRLCMSLSARPGSTGTRFHNFLYRKMGLNYVYKAFRPRTLEGAIAGIRALDIRGCAISMPYKEDVISLVDEMMPSATAISSVNTIVNDDGWLRAYNTDYAAIRILLERYDVPTDRPVVIRGSGGMAKAVACAFRDAGFADGRIIARNEIAGQALADTCGYGWAAELDKVDADILVNVTPIGMEGSSDADALAFEAGLIDASSLVFDVVALPAETPLIREARARKKPVITGAEVMTLQAVEQFVLYTGLRPSDVMIGEAEAFARHKDV